MNSSFLVDFVPGFLTHWPWRPRSCRLQNGYWYHILLSRIKYWPWKRFLTMLMWLRGDHTYQPILQRMVSPHLVHPRWKHIISKQCQTNKQLSVFLYPYLWEREKIHVYNPALIHCQVALFWKMRVFEWVHSVLITVSVHGWGECYMLWQQGEQASIALFPSSQKVDLIHLNNSYIITP